MAAGPQNATRVGIREDLSNVIYDISPTETPFLSSIAKKGSVKSTHFEWQTDALAAAVGTNAQLEGAAAGDATVNNTTRESNYTQISKKVVDVTGSGEAVDAAGKKSEMAYQLAKASKELKRDMEKTLLGTQTGAAEVTTSGSEAGRKTTGAAGFIATNAVAVADNAGVFNDSDILDAAEACWDAGGTPSTLLVGATDKKLITSMTGRAEQTQSVVDDNKSVYNAVDVYVSDFGTFNVVLDRYLPADTALMLDNDMWSVDYLRDFQTVDIAKDGDSDKKMLVVEYGLRCGNEAANAKITTA
jgi:hypothetical protein